MRKRLLQAVTIILLAAPFLYWSYWGRQVDQGDPLDRFGFIREIKSNTLVIDEVEFLSGEKARELGALDTGCPKTKIEECIPSMNNDFYIRNISSSTSLYILARGADVSYLSSPGSPILSSTTAESFLKSYPVTTRTLKYSQTFRYRGTGNKIYWLEEQYTP